MRTKAAYLVVALPRHSQIPRIRRATQSPPALDPGEACVKVALELPDDLFTMPLNTIKIEIERAVVGEAVEIDLEDQLREDS